MNAFIEAIKAAFEWFMSTSLPKDTADAIAAILNNAGTILSALMNEYISILFGA